jgi:hypothetical protein
MKVKLELVALASTIGLLPSLMFFPPLPLGAHHMDGSSLP